MSLPVTLLPFPAPVPSAKPDMLATDVRGNDNILRQRVNTLRDYVGQDKAEIATVTGSTTLDADADGATVLVDATGGAVTVTLPVAADAARRRYNIKKIDSSGNAVTVDGSGSETIDGALTAVLTTQWENVTVHCNGTAWFIL